MHFTNPLNWLWLLPLVGTVALLWLRRPRREELIVPSLRLWQGLTTPNDAQPSRRFLQKHLLLFLQLLLMFLLTLALARPFLFAREQAGQQYVLVLDNSASMRAVDVRPSRLEMARAAAAQFVSTRLRPADTALVLETSPRAALLCRMTSDPARLRNALAQIPPTDAPGDLRGALLLAQSAVSGKTNAQVQVYSDGVSAINDNSPAPPAHMETRQIAVGTARPDNIGITALDAQPNPDGGQTLTVTLHQAGTASHPGLTLSLLDSGALRDARQLAWTQGAAQATFDVPPAQSLHVVTVRLEHCADDLASDNSASLVLLPARATRVLLVSAGNIFLERGLASLPHVQMTEAAPAPFAGLRALASRADIVVLDGGGPLGAVPPGRYLTFNRSGLPTPFEFTSQPPADVSAMGQNSAHPVMRFVDMRPVRVRSAAQVQAASWADVLAGSRRGPLLAAGETGGSRVVSASFDLADSDWPLRIAFPLFLANSIAWLGEGSAPGTLQPGYAAGQAAFVALPPGSPSAQIAAPDGTQRTISAPLAGGIVSLPDTSQVGAYALTGPGGAHYPVAVNLLSPAASALAMRQPPMLSHALANSAPPALRRVPRDWWTFAALLALALLALEWAVYHRRA